MYAMRKKLVGKVPEIGLEVYEIEFSKQEISEVRDARRSDVLQ